MAAEAAVESQVGAAEWARISEAVLEARGPGRGTQEEVEGERVVGGVASGGAEGSGKMVGSWVPEVAVPWQYIQ